MSPDRFEVIVGAKEYCQDLVSVCQAVSHRPESGSSNYAGESLRNMPPATTAFSLR
jgi:hypothetical protein